MVAIHAAGEMHARPSNPLASQSRATLSFHARWRHYPDGDDDRARLLDNPFTVTTIFESRFPSFEAVDKPVLVNSANSREVFTMAWIENDKRVRENPVVSTFMKSIECGSLDWQDYEHLWENDPFLPYIYRGCDDMYQICNNGEYILEDPENASAGDITCIDEYRNNKKITRIPACIKHYKNLHRLSLTGTNVSRIENLDKNVDLKSLVLNGTPVSKIEGLDNLVNLEDLWLNDTKVSKIENLDKNVKLEYLFLDNTKIRRIKNLDNNVQLKQLDLRWTKVPDEEKRAFARSRPGLAVR